MGTVSLSDVIGGHTVRRSVSAVKRLLVSGVTRVQLPSQLGRASSERLSHDGLVVPARRAALGQYVYCTGERARR